MKFCIRSCIYILMERMKEWDREREREREGERERETETEIKRDGHIDNDRHKQNKVLEVVFMFS